MEETTNYIMRGLAKAPLWVVFAKVVDVPGMRQDVSLAVREVERASAIAF